MLESGSFKEKVRIGLADTERPVYTPVQFGERKDTTKNLSDAYQGMRTESAFLPPEELPIDQHSLVFLALPAASSHTMVTLEAHRTEANTIQFGSGRQESLKVPAHQFHWIYRQNGNTSEPLTHEQLAKLPYKTRRKILDTHAENILTGKKNMDQALKDQHIANAEKGSLVYATIGHHPIDERSVDGYARGPQSNPTIHTAVTFFQEPEDVVTTKKVTELTPEELLKDIDPLTSLFFDKTKEPIKSLLEHIIIFDHHIDANIEVLKENQSSNENVPYGWKITYKDKTTLADTMELAILFISQMQVLWDSAKKVRQTPADKTDKDERKIAKHTILHTVGHEGYKQLTGFLKTSGDRDKEETQEITDEINALNNDLEGMKINTKKYKTLEMRRHLLEDILADPSRFTFPGQPSFNVIFDVDAENDRVKSMFITPALSEKGVAEKVTGAILKRPERT